MTAGRAARGALLVVTLLAVATIALSSLTVFDFWWYLASGQRILETRSVPTTDPFSYTAEGRPWINHMWATQVLFTLLWERWGRFALIGLKTATVVATFGVVLATMRARGVHPLLASAVTLLAAWTGAEFWHARPQTFTYLFVAILGWLLRPGWERRRCHAGRRARAGRSLGEPPRGLRDGVPDDRDRRARDRAAAPRRPGAPAAPAGAWSGSRRASGSRRPPPAC